MRTVRCRAANLGHEAHAIRLRHRHADQVENRRHHVDEADDAADAMWGDRRHANDQRHAQDVLVELHAVAALASLSK